MPELPEVEAARVRLERWAAGRRLDTVYLVDPSSVRTRLSSRPRDAVSDPGSAVGGWVGGVAASPLRHGKRLGWAFGASGLLAHFGMSGKWIARPPGAEVPKFARIGLAFDAGPVCWFVDARRFGCVTVVPAEGLWAALREGLGPDALTACPLGPDLSRRFAVKRPLKVALLEQDRLAGLGNIHVAEALWRAGIHPDRRCDALTAAEWSRLSAAITAQLEAAGADLAGDQELTYLSEGASPNPFSVYGQRERPCPRCGGAIAAAQRGGRVTWWCPGCQPAKSSKHHALGDAG